MRGSLWKLRARTPRADCCELDVESAGPGLRAARRVLLAPFDRPVRESRTRPPRIVTRRAWMRAFLETVARERRCDRLYAPAAADIDLLAFQLEPAIAVVRQGATRVLLADAVGLGKTIQAALVLAELRDRRQLQRALVLTPPGLRDQWAGELRRRFGLDSVVADAAWLRAARADLPTSVNPWSVPLLAIASLDFVKRPDVRAGLEDLVWDLLIVDEAHAASRDSERRAAAHAIGRRARRVLLLTATPHDGDPGGYGALCAIGAVSPDEPITIFRRTRGEAGLAARRHVHILPVRLTEEERRLHARLLAYAGRVWDRRADAASRDSRLAMIVLLKRALSNASSLARSLEFRRCQLGPAGLTFDTQLPLPLHDDWDSEDEAHTEVLAAPGLDDPGLERLVLSDLADTARAMSPGDSKTRVLTRLLGRVRESCVVFTEYRDTLAALDAALPPEVTRAVLHGGLDRAARQDAVGRFEDGSARVLLATDAAGEGLNLQRRCRLVVNLELPWNPMRLEQRIGRVDRIGQHRTVHAINLVAAGTHEFSLLARLMSRLDRVRDSLGAADDVLGPMRELALADAVLKEDGVAVEPCWRAWQPMGPAPAIAVPAERPDLEETARLQRAHLVEQRSVRSVLDRCLGSHGSIAGAEDPRHDSLPIAAVSSRRLGGALRRPGVLAIFSACTSGEPGRGVDDMLVPVFVPWPVPAARRRRDARMALAALARELRDALFERARAVAEERLEEIGDVIGRAEGRALAREDGMDMAAGPRPAGFQPGLFDRRREREAERRARARADQRDGPAAHVPPRPANGEIPPGADPDLILLLLVTP